MVYSLNHISPSVQTYTSLKLGAFLVAVHESLKKSYTEKTNGQNNDNKATKPTHGSHSISVNYCNILAYFRVTDNKFKPALSVLSRHFQSCYLLGGVEMYKWAVWG